MKAYLVYVVIYIYFVNDFLVKRGIDISQEPIQFWYPMFWKHKEPFHIYEIHDSFSRICREILIVEVLDWITWESKDFLNEKG